MPQLGAPSFKEVKHLAVSHQVPEYTMWMTNRLVLDRKAPTIGSQTLSAHLHTLSVFLGYVKLFMRLGDQYMNLRMVGDITALAEFIAFLVARVQRTQTVINHIARLRHMLHFYQRRLLPAAADKRLVRSDVRTAFEHTHSVCVYVCVRVCVRV